MKRVEYSGRKVLVMGLGLHGGGAGVARFLVSRGASVTVTDLRSEHDLIPSVEELRGLPVRLVLGGHRERDFLEADLVIRNPGVPADSPYLRVAERAGIPVEMEMGLFLAEWPAERTIGVTGTRGKSTTASFIQHLLRTLGVRSVLAGNLRVSAVALLDGLRPDDTVVLELSSFQLEGLEARRLSPGVAVVTNLMPDHLNRYRDVAQYAEAKKTILKFQRDGDLAVLNRDDPYAESFATCAKGEVKWFSARDRLPGWTEARVSGAHNRANLSAGALAVSRFNPDEDTLAQAVRSFPGVPRRQELVDTVDGVRYVNDTTATTPEATLAALEAIPGPHALILGGSDKGLSFQALADRLAELGEDISSVVLLPGEGTDRLRAALKLRRVYEARDMDAAVEIARASARPGGAVVLSPACASFGAFLNEFDRGDRFNHAVAALRERRPAERRQTAGRRAD